MISTTIVCDQESVILDQETQKKRMKTGRMLGLKKIERKKKEIRWNRKKITEDWEKREKVDQ
jgi:hypothetical protein